LGSCRSRQDAVPIRGEIGPGDVDRGSTFGFLRSQHDPTDDLSRVVDAAEGSPDVDHRPAEQRVAAPHDLVLRRVVPGEQPEVLGEPTCPGAELGVRRNPLLNDLVEETVELEDGYVLAPDRTSAATGQ
jgi:hypothetical protein